MRQRSFKREGATAIIGAGPYRLSVAAHLKARGADMHVFGKPMEFWQRMPARLCLKSIWDASSLSDPDGVYTLDHYMQATGALKQEPLPLPYFLTYAQWFQKQNALEADPTYVRALTREGTIFRLDLADGRVVKAGRIVVAVGISAFTRVPDFASARGETLFLELSDGTTRTADFLFLGTGYRTDVRRLEFIDPTMQQQIVARDGYPELSEWFESTVPGLHFVGALAGQTFGPICRFVSGAKYPAWRIAQHVASAT